MKTSFTKNWRITREFSAIGRRTFSSIGRRTVLRPYAENCSPPLCGELFSALCGEQFSAIGRRTILANCLAMSWSSRYLLYSPVLWSGCGETSPPSLLSQSHQVSIQFVSDQRNNNAGFNITALEHTAGCGGLLHGLTGTVSSPRVEGIIFDCRF